MTYIAHAISKLFGILVTLFPREFRREYGQELRDDFSTLLQEAGEVNAWEFTRVCLRELRDLPMNLFRTHFGKERISLALHSRSLRFGGKGALTFGISLAVVNLLDMFLGTELVKFAFNHVQCFLLEAGCQPAASLFISILSWMAASVVGGLLFAVFFNGRSKFWNSAALAGIAFMVPGAAYKVLLFSAYGSLQWLSWAVEIATGLLLGALFASASERSMRKMILVVCGGVFYPLLAELSYRAVWAWFPPASTIYFLPAEVYRNVILEFCLAGITFGFLMGIILGFHKRKENLLQV
jgi:hypothetical protein